MKLTYQSGEFRCFTDFSEKDLIKGKGWGWAMYRTDGGEVGKFWYTNRVELALPFVNFADDTCRARLEDIRAEEERSRAMSRATDAEIDVPAPEGLAYLPYQKAGILFCLKVFGDRIPTKESKSRQ